MTMKGRDEHHARSQARRYAAMRVLLALKGRPGQSHKAPALRGRSSEAGFDDMAAKQFNLMTEWRLDAPVERVWPLLTSIEEWPLWWRAVSQVELLKAGDANGLGSIHRITWKTALPYQLTFDTRMTRIEPMSIITKSGSILTEDGLV